MPGPATRRPAVAAALLAILALPAAAACPFFLYEYEVEAPSYEVHLSNCDGLEFPRPSGNEWRVRAVNGLGEYEVTARATALHGDALVQGTATASATRWWPWYAPESRSTVAFLVPERGTPNAWLNGAPILP